MNESEFEEAVWEDISEAIKNKINPRVIKKNEMKHALGLLKLLQ